MKLFVKAVAVAAVVVAPALSFAQTDSSLTRDQVKQDLQQVEAAGYDPSRADQTSYPSDIQAAESRVARQNGGYGGTVPGASASGTRNTMPPLDNDGTKPIYFGR
jgi:hypothetical protein